jgi:hypothetical protein
MEIDAASPDVVLPFERPMYRPKAKVRISGDLPETAEDVDVSVLFGQTHVDPARLAGFVRTALRSLSQTGLAPLLAEHPVKDGLAELVTYLALTDPEFRVVFDEDAREQVSWTDADADADTDAETNADADTGAPAEAAEAAEVVAKTADLPRVSFVRATPGEDG